MFDKFCDYMYYLLPSPFKRIKKSLNQWYILFKVFGRRFDDAMESLHHARKQTMVVTCDPEMLPVHAEDRKMTRYTGEDDENFRRRIANHAEVLRLGGTDPGIMLAVKSLGYTDVTKVSAKEYTGDTDRWAEFYIIITMSTDDVHPIGFDIVKKQVRSVKQVGAKDNYSFIYQTAVKEPSSIVLEEHYKKQIYFFDYVKLDGEWNLSGSCLLDSKRCDYPVKVKFKKTIEHIMKEPTVTWHEEHDLYFLDGTYNLDGSKLLDAYQNTEVL